jgi:curved DNA-binding protein CbpA
MGNNASSTGKTYDQYYESLKKQNPKREIDVSDIDPYEVFGLSKNFEWDELKNSYRRIAKLVHPDKGGSEEVFNKVTDCFKVLASEYKLRKSDRQHHELKKEAEEYYAQQHGGGVGGGSARERSPEEIAAIAKKFSSKEKGADGMTFSEKFNRAFEDNRLEDEDTNKGYGHMMAESSKNREDIEVPTYIKPGKKFDQNSFNKTFETVSLPKSSEIVKYREPEALPLAKNLQYTELGENVDDFSSSATTRDSRGLQYTDYMKAYTTTRLVDPRAVEKRANYKTVGEYESARERVLAKPATKEELQWKAKKERDAEKAEDERLRRLNKRDQQAQEHHERMNRLLLGDR